MKPKLLFAIKFAIVGGAPFHLMQLARHFSQFFDIHIAVGTGGEMADDAISEGFTVHHIPSLGSEASFSGLPKMSKDFTRLLEEVQPDLVHLHAPLINIVGRYACWKKSIPCIATVHSWNFVPGMPTKRRIFSWVLEFLVSKLKQPVLTVSKYDRNLGIDYRVIAKRQIDFVHNGIPDSAPLETQDESPHPPRVIMVSRFDHRKCQHELIEALAKLNTSWELLFAGEGVLLDDCKALASQLGVAEKVQFLGNRRDIEQLLHGSDIFVLATEVEGLPLSIIEAMRAKLPVIANNVGGISELVDHGVSGYLVPANDIDGMSQHLEELLENADLRNSMAAAGRARFTAMFEEQAMLSAIQTHYERTTGKRLSTAG